jgi:hypothetical protein
MAESQGANRTILPTATTPATTLISQTGGRFIVMSDVLTVVDIE